MFLEPRLVYHNIYLEFDLLLNDLITILKGIKITVNSVFLPLIQSKGAENEKRERSLMMNNSQILKKVMKCKKCVFGWNLEIDYDECEKHEGSNYDEH